MPDEPDKGQNATAERTGDEGRTGGSPLAAGCTGAVLGGIFALLTFAAFGTTVLYSLDRAGVIQWGHDAIPPLEAEEIEDLRQAPVWRTGNQFVYRVQRKPPASDSSASSDQNEPAPTDEAAALGYHVVFEIIGVEQTDEALEVSLRRRGGMYSAEERTWRITDECLHDQETGETWFCRDASRAKLAPEKLRQKGQAEPLEAFRWEKPPIRSAFRPDLGLVDLARVGDDDRRWSYRLAGWSSASRKGGIGTDAVFTCDWHAQTARDTDVDKLPNNQEHRYEEAAAGAGLGADVDVRTLSLSGRNLADRAALLSNHEGTLLVLERGAEIVARHRLPDRTYAAKVWRGRDTRPDEAGHTAGPEVLHILMARGDRLRLALLRVSPETAHGLTWTFDRKKGHDRYSAHILADTRACYFQFRNHQPDSDRLVADFELTDDGFRKRRGSLQAASTTRFTLSPSSTKE